MTDIKKYAYWLSCVEKFSPRMRKHLFSIYSCAEEIYRQKKEQLSKVPGLTEEDIGHILDAKKGWDIDGQWQKLSQQKIAFTSMEDADYPLRFRELSQPPYSIFYRGRLPGAKEFCAAIVGARMCSEYGRGMAKAIAGRLADLGVPVVSGMARGIDAAGHRGALDNGGDTYAVFGCGVDVCYPDYHRQLYYDIVHHGGLLSEYPPQTKPLAHHFPQRNRLISALSDAVLVIEAKQKSGSLITADFALEQGKDVYALPGRVTDALSGGCNRLIAQGAGIILSAEDFLAELRIEAVRKGIFRKEMKKNSKSEKIPLEKEELMVYSCLGLLPTGIEEILSKTGLDMQTAGRILMSLQQKNQIEEIYKNYYKIL